MRVLGLIPARGGSKGIPRKNIRLLHGKPLLQYTAEAALGSRTLTRVILSTEDEEILAVGRLCGLDAPFLRPECLARDDTGTLAVIQHAVRWLEDAGDRYDAVCLLQPTNPLRRSDHIDACVVELERTAADAVFTMLRVPDKYNPHWVYTDDGSGRLVLATGDSSPIPRRQDLPPAYHREGSVYVTRRDVLMERNSLYGNRVAGFLMDPSDCVNIDGPEDWARAEQMVCNRQR